MNKEKISRLIDNAITALTKAGARVAFKDGKVTFDTKLITGGPWMFIKHTNRMNCTLWKFVIFGFIVPQLPFNEQFIPSGCHDCYKVVIRPEKYVELFHLEDLQKELGFPSKCGIETRDYVKGLYGGYFYCRGLKEGKQRYKKVAIAIGKHPDLRHLPVILKRGCTEFENQFGPSDTWEISPMQKEIENIVNERITLDPLMELQPEEEQKAVYKRWQRFAYKYDKSYDGPELNIPVITYHSEGENRE